MPAEDPTRQWAVIPDGGPDELKRSLKPIRNPFTAPTREYAVCPGGGPDELKRAGGVEHMSAEVEKTSTPTIEIALPTRKEAESEVQKALKALGKI